MGRLGHGKGYYDRFISEYLEKNGRLPVLSELYFPGRFMVITFNLLVALSLKQQVITEDIPMAETDWKLDAIVTPDEIITSDNMGTLESDRLHAE